MNLFEINTLVSLAFYILWIIVFVFAFKYNSKLGLFIIVLIVLVLAVFRYGSGTDYFIYRWIFEYSKSLGVIDVLSGKSYYEIFFSLFLLVFYPLNLNFYFFIAVHASLILLIVYLWIKSNSNYPTQAFFVYFSTFFLVWNLSALRQVIPLLLGSYLLFNQKYEIKWKYKFLISLILSFFHYSALFYCAILLLELIPWNKEKLIIFFIGSLILSILPMKEIALGLRFIPFITLNPIYQKLLVYLNTMPTAFGFWDISSLMRLFFIVLLLSHYGKLVKISPYIKRLVQVCIFGLSFFFILRFNSITAQRITIYPLILLTILLPEVLHIYDHSLKIIRNLVLAMFIGVNALIYFKDLYAMKYQMGIKDGNWFVEYHHIFEKNSPNK
jgi:hypothetical protein